MTCKCLPGDEVLPKVFPGWGRAACCLKPNFFRSVYSIQVREQNLPYFGPKCSNWLYPTSDQNGSNTIPFRVPRIYLYYIAELVRDEKEDSKWFPERSEYRTAKMNRSEIVSANCFSKTLHKRKQFFLK